jgi:hypothetical protein
MEEVAIERRIRRDCGVEALRRQHCPDTSAEQRQRRNADEHASELSRWSGAPIANRSVHDGLPPHVRNSCSATDKLNMKLLDRRIGFADADTPAGTRLYPPDRRGVAALIDSVWRMRHLFKQTVISDNTILERAEIGSILLASRNPEALRAWYERPFWCTRRP